MTMVINSYKFFQFDSACRDTLRCAAINRISLLTVISEQLLVMVLMVSIMIMVVIDPESTPPAKILVLHRAFQVDQSNLAATLRIAPAMLWGQVSVS